MLKSKKFIVLTIATLLMLLIIEFRINATTYTPKNCPDGKVVVHYRKLDGIYDGVGLGTWGNGNSGSVAGINKSGVDDFGAVIEICVDRSSAKTNYNDYGFTPYKQGMPADGSNSDWQPDAYKDSLNKVDIHYDRQALMNRTVDVIHIYFISGEAKVYYSNPLLSSKNEFVAFDALKATGTFAKTTKEINVVLKNLVDVSTIADELALTNALGTEISIESVIAVNPTTENKALQFTITLVNELDKSGSYTLNYNNGEATIDVKLDTTAPIIDYTNKVKANTSMYDDRIKSFLIEKGATFNINDYIRLNVLDDREGNITDQVQIIGTIDTNVLGSYTLTILATDAWGNTREKEFTFQVVEKPVVVTPGATTTTQSTTSTQTTDTTTSNDGAKENSNNNLGLVIGGGVVVLILIGSLSTLFFRKRS